MTTRSASQSARSLAGLLLIGLQIVAQPAEPQAHESPAAAPIDFTRDIRPIFEASCFRCHGPEKPKSKFRLDNQESALKGGVVNTNDIVPFRSAESVLIQYVIGADDETRMPPPGKGDPLTPDQIVLLRTWIDQGAKWPAESSSAVPDSSLSVTPVVGWIGVSGNQQKFQEDWSRKPGFVIGFDDFELREAVGKDAEFVATGRAVFDQSDYKVTMSLTRPDLGFVNGGYVTYRKYFNDTGGYYPFSPPPPLGNQPPFSLNQDLYVDNQRAWFNVGMTVPDLPKVTIGYEYLSRSGQESTLNWSQYSTDPNEFFGKAIVPSYRDTAQSTQIIKLDASYGIDGFLLEDSFRGEFYNLNQATGTRSGYYSVDGFGAQKESYTHFQAANAFRVEKQLRPWCFVSGGYLYTHLNGDASVERLTGFGPPAYPFFLETDTSQGITLEQHSHTVNANTLVGPWQGFTLSAGIQAEWQQRQGMGDLFIDQGPGFGTNHIQSSNLNKTAIEEDVLLRYTQIPFTVVYAEARFAQETYDLYQDSFVFLQDTESTVNLQDYKAGITFSPWQPVALDVSYRYRDKRNTYNDGAANDPFVDNGYPGFLQWLDIASNDLEARLTLRPNSWLKTTLKYQLVSTEYRNSVSPGDVFIFPNTVRYDGGQIKSGDYDANVYSINLTLTPWRRLYLSASFSYADTRTISGINDYADFSPSVVAPYEGQIYSVVASANYALNKSTDLTVTYSFSKADYQQDNLGGLPLGIVYDRNAVLAGIKRRFSKNVTGSIQYAFSIYDEPSAVGANNYTANAIFASVKLLLP